MAQVGRLGRAALARAMPATRAAVAPSVQAVGIQKNLAVVLVPQRTVSSSALRMHRHGHKDDEEELVALQTGPGAQQPSVPIAHHDHDDEDQDDEDDEDMEDMVAIGPAGKEWGGPTRGGKFKEPTRYGDWERKGRCSDF